MRYRPSKPHHPALATAIGRGAIIGAGMTLLQLVSLAAALIYAGILDL